MTIAACDPEAFYPLRSLVSGPFTDLASLQSIERFVRTVVLHDEIVMQLLPFPYDPEGDTEWTEEERLVGGRSVIVAMGPDLSGYDFFADRTYEPLLPEIELSTALLESAAEFANAGEGNVYFDAHVKYLRSALGIVEQGGSALLCSEFGQVAINKALRYPERLFQSIDEDWQRFGQELAQDGARLVVPPVLGIILQRAAKREAIPSIICDLRDEWAVAREKVWNLVRELRSSPTLARARDIQKGLSDASKAFSPVGSIETGTNPIRVLWEILASAASGATIAQLSGGRLLTGAVTGAVNKLAGSVTPLVQEVGPTIFRLGAFDLARRVQRATAQVEFDSLQRLLSEGEKQKLGIA